ncbi:conjugal transfer protein TraB [Streptomyces virginiae]|uniref:conjugal transfer protein TraB n=1 Tax=Streptomyces virginiae TaxID=1961 RepID=UPI003660B609
MTTDDLNTYLPAVALNRTPGFVSMTARVAMLSAAALALNEGLSKLRRQMNREADEADALAEMCTAAEVEPRFTALMHEGAAALRAVADASAAVVRASADLHDASEELRKSHDREYRGVYEAVRASDVQQAKPGFYRTR